MQFHQILNHSIKDKESEVIAVKLMNKEEKEEIVVVIDFKAECTSTL